MTTSRIYAYRWPARLVSHKPFAAENYSITPSCIWQVFFRKKNEFSFLFSLFCGIAFFLCKMHNPIPFYGWKTPPRPVCKDSLRSTHILHSTWFQKGISHSLFKTSLNLSPFHAIVIITLSKDPCVRLII